MKKSIYIAGDHGAFDLKTEIFAWLQGMCYLVEDLGTYSNKSVNYPDYADILCKKLLENQGSFGILMCGTGIGISIAANRFRGIRAALCVNEYMAKMARQHNDANVLVMGARVVGSELAKSISEAFLKTEFEGGRHCGRVEMLDNLAP